MLKYRCTVICPCGPTRVTLDNPVKLGFFNALHHDIQYEPTFSRLDNPVKLGAINAVYLIQSPPTVSRLDNPS